MNTRCRFEEPAPKYRKTWLIPETNIDLWLGKKHKYCVVIPVINEGTRIKSLLKKMQAQDIPSIADIIIIDGGSSDGSLNIKSLKKIKVIGLLVKKGPGGLSAQLRSAYAFALDNKYQGIITIDGNDKDDPEAIHSFIKALDDGADFVQASRFVPGGIAKNTPKIRYFAIRFIHAPFLRFSSGFEWTDSTQGFRAYSRRMLLDPKIAPFREIFINYELLVYLSYRAPSLGYSCRELPSIRRYPINETPTKIHGFKGNFGIFQSLIFACLGIFNPD
jgi:dolichol-phosphate mannosyltransferase